MRSLTRHFFAAPLPRRSLSTTSSAFPVVSSDAKTSVARRRECIVNACCADANACCTEAAAVRGCKVAVRACKLTALVPRRRAMWQSQSTICEWYDCNLVASAPRKDGTALASVLPAASPAHRVEKSSMSQIASAAVAQQIPLPLRPTAQGPAFTQIWQTGSRGGSASHK